LKAKDSRGTITTSVHVQERASIENRSDIKKCSILARQHTPASYYC